MVKGLGVLTEVQVTEVNITESRQEQNLFQIFVHSQTDNNPPQNFSDLYRRSKSVSIPSNKVLTNLKWITFGLVRVLTSF